MLTEFFILWALFGSLFFVLFVFWDIRFNYQADREQIKYDWEQMGTQKYNIKAWQYAIVILVSGPIVLFVFGVLILIDRATSIYGGEK